MFDTQAQERNTPRLTTQTRALHTQRTHSFSRYSVQVDSTSGLNIGFGVTMLVIGLVTLGYLMYVFISALRAEEQRRSNLNRQQQQQQQQQLQQQGGGQQQQLHQGDLQGPPRSANLMQFAMSLDPSSASAAGLPHLGGAGGGGACAGGGIAAAAASDANIRPGPFVFEILELLVLCSVCSDMLYVCMCVFRSFCWVVERVVC